MMKIGTIAAIVLVAGAGVARATPVQFNYIGAAPQLFQAPTAGTYQIIAYGAAGGSAYLDKAAPGGGGAEIGGDFVLTKGELLNIYVGGMPELLGSYVGAGGGGAFVVAQPGTPLAIAGGGGGGFSGFGRSQPGGPGQAGPDGQAGGAGPGGTGGAGGKSADGGGGGGGFRGDGSNDARTNDPRPYLFGEGGHGYADLRGGQGTAQSSADPFPTISGGFGGGGGATYDPHIGTGFGSGGGGGYSGGGGGLFNQLDTGTGGAGGGGGSFDAGLDNADLIHLAGVNTDDGRVVITLLDGPPTDVPEPSALALLGSATIGFVALRRRLGRHAPAAQ